MTDTGEKNLYNPEKESLDLGEASESQFDQEFNQTSAAQPNPDFQPQSTFDLKDLYGENSAPSPTETNPENSDSATLPLADEEKNSSPTSATKTETNPEKSAQEKESLATHQLAEVLIELHLTDKQDAPLIQKIQVDLNLHLEIIDVPNPKQAIFDLVARHLWQDIIDVIGATGIIGKKEPAQINEAIKENYWQKLVLSTESEELKQIDFDGNSNDTIVAEKLGTLLYRTLLDINGQVTPEMWNQIQTQYHQKRSSATVDLLNRRLSQLVGLGEINLSPSSPETVAKPPITQTELDQLEANTGISSSSSESSESSSNHSNSTETDSANAADTNNNTETIANSNIAQSPVENPM